MKKLLLSLICLLVVLLCMMVASADTPPMPPTPWNIDLEDGLVFHYRPEYAHYSIHGFARGTPTEFKEQGYPRTGLYRDGALVYAVQGQYSYFGFDALYNKKHELVKYVL